MRNDYEAREADEAISRDAREAAADEEARANRRFAAARRRREATQPDNL